MYVYICIYTSTYNIHTYIGRARDSDDEDANIAENDLKANGAATWMEDAAHNADVGEGGAEEEGRGEEEAEAGGWEETEDRPGVAGESRGGERADTADDEESNVEAYRKIKRREAEAAEKASGHSHRQGGGGDEDEDGKRGGSSQSKPHSPSVHAGGLSIHAGGYPPPQSPLKSERARTGGALPAKSERGRSGGGGEGAEGGQEWEGNGNSVRESDVVYGAEGAQERLAASSALLLDKPQVQGEEEEEEEE